MADIELSQHEADHLFALPKERTADEVWDFPGVSGGISVPLASVDRREQFSLDISRGQIKLTKVKYQNRVRTAIVLARLDIDGPPHRNPDDQEVPCPHRHLYREGFGTKWAFPLPTDFTVPNDARITTNQFMTFCNIITPPVFRFDLFA